MCMMQHCIRFSRTPQLFSSNLYLLSSHVITLLTNFNYFQVHAKNTDIENTKMVTEMQSFKNLDVNKESMLTHFKEEVGRLQQCLSEKEKLQKEMLVHSSNMVRTVISEGKLFSTMSS